MSSQPPSETTTPPPPTPPAPTPKKKKKKRKKSTNSDAATLQTADTSPITTKLSLKKVQFLKKSAKQTPWYDVNELYTTGRDLLLALKLFPSHTNASAVHSCDAPLGLTNEEHSQLHAALRRVALWRGRSDRGGRLPHAIDVTAGLAEVLLMDAERSRDASIINRPQNNSAGSMMSNNNVSLYQLRNSYSTLLLRSVNGLADTYRNQKKSALLSVAHCCSLAGLPLWIVDVRHDASHNELPSLSVCRIGALESLKFWRGRYWDSLREKVWGDISQGGDLKKESGGALDNESEAGVYTLTMDWLVRYQKATDVEAVERRKVLQTKKRKSEKKEYQRYSYWQKFSRQNSKVGEITSTPVATEEDDVMLLNSEKDDKPDTCEEGSAKKQKLLDNKTNPWWILEDSKPKKKKGNKVSQDADEDKSSSALATSATVIGNDNSTAPTTQPSSRECAVELIKTAPIDTLYSTALQFLVLGRGANHFGGLADSLNDTEVSGPALLALTDNGIATSDLHVEDAFEESRVSYEPLIVAIASSYPGFLAALFVHLIDSILCIDTERSAHQQSTQNNNEVSENDTATYLNEMEWNLQCLAMWASYILTREFHMHLDRSVAHTESIGDDKINEMTSNVVDLKKKGRRKWTPKEQNFMQSPIPYALLRGMGFPLNSVCDRLVTHLDGAPSLFNDKSVNTVAVLLLFFEQVLEEDRVWYNVSQHHVANGDVPKTADSDNVGQININSWTLCKSWDACAIGTMSGFPA